MTKVEVEAKRFYQSKGFMGSAVAAGGTLIFGLQAALQTPGGLAGLCGNIQDKWGPIAAIVLGVATSLYGNADRKDVFLRGSKLKEVAQDAADRAMNELTGAELAQTAQQAFGVITAPADERLDKIIDLVVDSQKRLQRVEEGLTANQFPALDELPKPTRSLSAMGMRPVSMPMDPRQEQSLQAAWARQQPAEQVELSGVEMNNVTNSSDGVLNPEDVI